MAGPGGTTRGANGAGDARGSTGDDQCHGTLAFAGHGELRSHRSPAGRAHDAGDLPVAERDALVPRAFLSARRRCKSRSLSLGSHQVNVSLTQPLDINPAEKFVLAVADPSNQTGQTNQAVDRRVVPHLDRRRGDARPGV